MLSHPIVRTWLVAMYGSMKLVTRVPVGTRASAAYADRRGAQCLAGTRTSSVRCRGRVTRGCLIAYLVIASLVLSTSVKLGIVVLVTAPLIVFFAMPLLRPLQRREEIERTRTSD